jgi:hypothetical protein
MGDALHLFGPDRLRLFQAQQVSAQLLASCPFDQAWLVSDRR